MHTHYESKIIPNINWSGTKVYDYSLSDLAVILTNSFKVKIFDKNTIILKRNNYISYIFNYYLGFTARQDYFTHFEPSQS